MVPKKNHQFHQEALLRFGFYLKFMKSSMTGGVRFVIGVAPGKSST